MHVCALKLPIPQSSKALKENLVLSPQQQMWTIVGFLPAVDESMIDSRQPPIKLSETSFGVRDA